jgi:hypothetical protein
MLGYSQGSLIGRGALQRCSLPVFNLITLSGIHQGIFGVPYLTFIPEEYRVLITKYVYELPVQHAVSVANYRRDPTQLTKYTDDCLFLSDINNEDNSPQSLGMEKIAVTHSFAHTSHFLSFCRPCTLYTSQKSNVD